MGIGQWFGKGSGKNQGMVVHLFDDNTFDFETKPVDRSFFVEKKNGEIVAGWKDSYALRKVFPGYAKIKSGLVTLIYPRDIILDLFNQAPKHEKPAEHALLSHPYFTKIAENTLNDIQSHNKQLSSLDRLILILGAALAVEMIGFFLVIMSSRGLIGGK